MNSEAQLAELRAEAIPAFVLDALSPQYLGALAPRLPCPEFARLDTFWDGALDYADRIHARAPLIASLARVPWLARLPNRICEEIQMGLSRARMTLALLDEELEVAGQALTEAGIPFALLKGADLGRRFYPERLLRPMADIDLLVPKHQFSRAISALRIRGFQVIGPLPPGRIRIEMSRGPRHMPVELHWALQADDAPEIEHLPEETRIPGLPFPTRVLPETDLLVYLIRHAGHQHCIEFPIWLLDIFYLLRSRAFGEGAVWAEAVGRLRERRANAAAWFIFQFLNRNWRASVPRDTLADLGLRLGLLHRGLLGAYLNPLLLFPLDDRSVMSTTQRRFLLRDSTLEAVKYGIKREFALKASS